MKKIILSTAFFLLLGLTALFANDKNPVSPEIRSSFKKDFSSANHISWHKQKEYEVASFVLNGETMNAYYNEKAEMIVVVHNMLSDHLPIYLMSSLKNNFADFWITELFETAAPGESNYHIKLENADQVVVMRSVDSAEWVLEKKTKKYQVQL